MQLTDLINDYVHSLNTGNRLTSIKLAYQIAQIYQNSGHYASALSYYVNVLEAEDSNTELIYECLLQNALCVWQMGNRDNAVKSCLFSAVAVCPDRPEAYHLLSLDAEKKQQWIECYMNAKLAERYSGNCKLNNVNYDKRWSHIFQIGVSSWWLGKYEESASAFTQLANEYASLLPKHIKQLVVNNIRTSGIWHPETKYNLSMWNNLKNKFQGSELIEKNYSQTFQDLFVLTMLQGKRHGFFLELGAADPFWQSNTALLEQFDWNGISIDITAFDYSERKTQFIAADALELDYKKILKKAPKNIDYLQLDCDPPHITYSILTRIPFDTYKFAVITFEHDAYIHGDEWVIKSREYLTARGYKLIVSNVAPDRLCAFEDWWIHPDLVEESIYSQFMDTTDSVKKSSDVLLDV